MNAIDALLLLLGIIALLGGGYYLYTQQPTQQTQSIPEVTWNVPSAARVDELTTFSADILQGIGSAVQLRIGDAVYDANCATNPCRVTFEHSFAAPGLHGVLLRVGEYSFSRNISVTDTVIRCIDGTRHNACATPPQQCVNGKFISNCELCGCPSGKLCQATQCVAPSIQFGIGALTSVVQGSQAQVTLPLTNNSAVTIDDLFLVYVDVYDNTESLLSSFPQQVRVQPLSPGMTTQTQASIQLPSRAARIGARIFSLTPEGNPDNEVGKTTSTVVLAIVTDGIAPSPPTNLRSTSEDDVTTLHWNASPSSDVSGYVIYRQNAGSQQFITYSVLAETSATSYVLPASTQSLLYTVRAKDFSGNLSDPTRGIAVAGNAT